MAEVTDIKTGQLKGKSVGIVKAITNSFVKRGAAHPRDGGWSSGAPSSGPGAYWVLCWTLASNPTDLLSRPTLCVPVTRDISLNLM